MPIDWFGRRGREAAEELERVQQLEAMRRMYRARQERLNRMWEQAQAVGPDQQRFAGGQQQLAQDFVNPGGLFAVDIHNIPVYQPPAPVVDDGCEEQEIMINKFMLGCDPEFAALDAKGRQIQADQFIYAAGEVGYDHGGRLLEFRPAPAKGAFALVKRIQRLMKHESLAKINAAKFRAGAKCWQDSLGGHVHFGIKPYKIEPGYNNAGISAHNLTPQGVEIVAALDKTTSLLEHLDILPKAESIKRRESGQGYGRAGDIRDCHGHLEYRTMASWLYDPRVAYLCLTAAKLAAADPAGALDALRNVTSFEGLKNWVERYKNQDANALRACEKVLDKGLKALQVDPEVDFRERWERLGL